MSCRRFRRHTSSIFVFLLFLLPMYLGILYVLKCGDPIIDSYIVQKMDVGAPVEKYKTFLAVLVTTSSNHIEKRDAARETWLTYGNSSMFKRFVIGTGSADQNEVARLNRENRGQGDLLLLDNVHDSYSTLSSKVLHMLAWLDRNVDFEYVLKVDDDSFARLDVMEKELKQRSGESLYWGFFHGDAKVPKEGPLEDHDWVLCDRYVPYALGGGYVLSADLVHYIAANVDSLKLYRSEDVTVGAWLGPLSIKREHDVRFDTMNHSRGCSNQYLVTHKQSEDEMRKKHQHLQKTGRLCETEYRKAKSYVYDWTVLPSACCKKKSGII
ncbi:beta-1,3-galactosyltransferase 6-like [Branchiostoma floridae x Branchiostoma belcheri]